MKEKALRLSLNFLVAPATPSPSRCFRSLAKPEGDRVQLAWSTTSEQDADHFIVERSANLTEFMTVGKVAARAPPIRVSITG
jgi:hypothetical protein